MSHTAPAAVALPATETLSYRPEGTTEDYIATLAQLSPAIILALARSGFAKVIGNAGSNSKALLASAAKKAGAAEPTEDEVRADQASRREQVFADLLDGTYGESRGRASSSDPLAPYIRTILEGAVRKHCTKTRQTLPQGKALTEACDAVLAQVGEARVRAAAQAAYDAANAEL